MKIAIATDSTSGIQPEEAKELGITVVPMPVTIDGREYFESVDLDHGFFSKAGGEGRYHYLSALPPERWPLFGRNCCKFTSRCCTCP